MASDRRSWMETMNYIASEPGRPLILIVLAQNNGASLDEMNLAASAGMLHQQVTGHVVETAIMVKHIIDLSNGGFIERDEGGFKWQMTPLGTLVSRQWVPGEIEPEGFEPLSPDEIRGWRDRVLQMMELDADLAKQANIPPEELLLTQSRRLTELHILNRVLGDQEIPDWLKELRDAGLMPDDLQA